ncbi:hypothetical protein BHU11_02570 [Tannerella sp. oral taxon 808]|nr:hypothetical protein BHU11_02570 [Tannerella sp. oral taxon 808]
MNKKVFTLLAASLMLLLGAVGASARPTHGDSVKYLPDGTGKGAYHLKISYIGLEKIKDGKNDSCFLIMDQEGRITRADSAYVWNDGGDPDSAFFKLRSSLWCVNVSRQENFGKVPAFTFINKEYGTELAFEYQPYMFTDTGTTRRGATVIDTVYRDSMARLTPSLGIDLIAGQTMAPLVGGNLSKWKFSRTYNAAYGSAELEKDQYLAIEVKPDYYLTFAVPTGGASRGKIRLVVAHKNEFKPTTKFYQNNLVRFRLVSASPRVLTAHDFNTKMHQNPTEDFVKLFFDPDVSAGQTNVFAQDLKATDVSAGTRGHDNHYLYLNTRGGQYITMSTTDYNSALGIRYPKIEETGATNDDQSKWRLVYYPSEDSLIINVRGYKNHVSYGNQKDPETYPKKLPPYNNLYNDDVLNYLIVRVQDLNTSAGRVVTVANAPANTRIHFNIFGCKVYDTDRTTVDGNLYTVRDREGRYLVVPLYAGDLTPQWRYLEKTGDGDVLENANRTPSYQWFVTRVNDGSGISKIHLTNREFNDVRIEYVQVYNDYHLFKGVWHRIDDAGKGRDYSPIMGRNYVRLDGFTKVPKPYRNDPYLGYKFFSQKTDMKEAIAEATDSLNWFAYAFNYLNRLSDGNHYMGFRENASSTDTGLYVLKDDKTYFQLVVPDTLRKEAYGPEKYGIGWDDNLLTNFSDPKSDEYIAPLVRWFYHLQVNDYWKFKRNENYVVMDDNLRYGYTPERNANSRRLNKAKFYLRFTYETNGKDYYTLLDRIDVSNFHYLTYVKGLAVTDTIKAYDWSHGNIKRNSFGVVAASVTDHDPMYVAAQPKTLGTYRVSTFALTHETEPLYRRFNTLDEGSVATDDPDTVAFYRMAKPSDYLYEDAHSVYSATKKQNAAGYSDINFAGVENADDAIKNKDKDQVYKRHIDTDWAIYVDTAYVNRGTGVIKPQYLLVVGPEKGWLGCPVCGEDELNREYIYGRYLRNETDSARTDPQLGSESAIRDRNYILPTKWDRLAFTPAIHAGDTLYVLNGVPIEEFYVKAANGQRYVNYKKLNNNKRVKKVFLGNNLHKDEVFSFRFTTPGGKHDNKQFLIESETWNRGAGRMIAPMQGGWIKIQNGVPVISRGSYYDAITEAEKWNVRKTDKAPLANKEVATTNVVVTAGVGNVTVLNASGKAVTVSNILGQTVAKAVLASDNETIAAPQGVVIVSIEGESAVKAVVK